MNQQTVDGQVDDGLDERYDENYYFLDRRAKTGRTTPVVWGASTITLGDFTPQEIEQIRVQLELSYSRRDIRDEDNTNALAFAAGPTVIYLESGPLTKGKYALAAITTGPRFERTRALDYVQKIATSIPRKAKILGIF